MDTKPLERFATQARRDLLSSVDARATAVLATGSVARAERPEAVRKLEAEITAHGRAHVIDKVAYTWFNRIIALRFMDARGYTDAGIVSPAQGQAHGQPEILAEAKRGNLDTDVAINKITAETILSLLDGSRRSTDAQGEAYALLLTEYCRYWHKSMPFMFEREGDYTELLVPTGLLADGAILSKARQALTVEACEDVEVIGWLYQFYISERKDEVFAGFKKNKKAGVDEIPAATQLFTPHWIVRYLVENSVGRLWMLNRPTSRLVERMDYFIAPVDDDTDFLKITGPEELTVIDPACGSGHMLTYAFDLLYAIYEEEGYAPSEIPRLILTHNIHGMEIDPRAGSLAAFALTMKARAKHRTFFSTRVQPIICVIEPIYFRPDELDLLNSVGGAPRADESFWNQFAKADTVGSLIRPRKLPDPERATHVVQPQETGDLLFSEISKRAARVVTQATILARRYAALVANPPYMGNGNMGAQLSDFASQAYPLSKLDLFSMFIERSMTLVHPQGLSALVTMEAWMYRAAYSKFRSEVILRSSLVSVLHMPYLGQGRTTMGIAFGTTALVLRPKHVVNTLTDFQCVRHFELDSDGAPLSFPVKNELANVMNVDEFARIPGTPIVYGASHGERAALASRPRIDDQINAREGLTTGDNARFLRRWYEVSRRGIATPTDDFPPTLEFRKHRWFMCSKGGDFRRWYGNLEYVVDWEDDGYRVRTNVDSRTGRVRSHNYNGEFAFRSGFTWSGISSSRFSARYVPPGHMFDTTGPMGFAPDDETLYATIAILNSGSTDRYLTMLAPAMAFKIGQVLGLPMPADPLVRKTLAKHAVHAIGLARQLWDAQEVSLDFRGRQPLPSGRVADVVRDERDGVTAKLEALADIRDDIDQVLAEAYGFDSPELAGRTEAVGLTPSVGEQVRDLVSYAVGCMFGRYSIDEPGLILANQGATVQDYLARVSSPTLRPDHDNVIPLVDDGWFEDDVVERFRHFLRVTFGAEHFEENLRFVEESLGVKTMRDYFITKAGKSRFYDDHVQRYKKRPIYWMFSSPKGSFNALIYMHRYNPSTVSTVLNEYLREYRAKLEVALTNADRTGAAGSTKDQREADRLRKVLAELSDYEHDVLYPLATQQVAINLDDGVKANYPKFYPAVRKIAGLEAAE